MMKWQAFETEHLCGGALQGKIAALTLLLVKMQDEWRNGQAATIDQDNWSD